MTFPSVFTTRPVKHLCIIEYLKVKVKFTSRYLFLIIRAKKENKEDIEIILYVDY